MIYYTSGGNWFRDIRHLSTSWTMTRVVRGTLIIGVYTALIAYLIIEIEHFNYHLDDTIFSFLGIVLSILLVFRTNTAYDRWWEGRKQWGALVNNTRNLALLVNESFKPDDMAGRKLMAKHIANFCFAFVEHLRDGTKLDKLIYLTEEDKEVYESLGHVPNYISGEIYGLIRTRYDKGEIGEADFINLKPNWNSLLDILGACERIKKTPIPFSYAVFIKILIISFCAMLPFALIDNFGYLSVPLMMVVFFAFLGMEMMAEEIEEPFGTDCNDLPTGDIAHTIKGNVYEILMERSSLKNQRKVELYQKLH